jgi:hypothetical protein
MEVTLISDTEYGLSGINVFVHPPTVKNLESDKTKGEEYWVAWYPEIPDRCLCD